MVLFFFLLTTQWGRLVCGWYKIGHFQGEHRSSSPGEASGISQAVNSAGAAGGGEVACSRFPFSAPCVHDPDVKFSPYQIWGPSIVFTCRSLLDKTGKVEMIYHVAPNRNRRLSHHDCCVFILY